MAGVKVSYQIEDGYVSGSRPQSTIIDTSCFDVDMNEAQIKQEIYDQIYEAMINKIEISFDEEDIFEDVMEDLMEYDEDLMEYDED